MSDVRPVRHCPYCGSQVADSGWAEKSHMERAHPEIVAERLAVIGETPAAETFTGGGKLVYDLVLAMPKVLHALEGLDVENVKLEANGPWVQITATVHLQGPRKWAVWTRTGVLHRILPDGSVSEDPVPDDDVEFRG